MACWPLLSGIVRGTESIFVKLSLVVVITKNTGEYLNDFDYESEPSEKIIS